MQQPPIDATTIMYVAEALMIANGVRFLAEGKAWLGGLSVLMGVVLIVQRIIRNRKRPKP